MIIYGRLRSRAARCMWLLEEMGLPYRLELVDSQKGDNRTPEFLAINPSAKVPVLDDDGFILRESLAINAYLVEKAETPLWPAHIQHRALINQWSDWAVTEVEGPLAMVALDRMRAAAAGVQPNAALATDGVAMVKKALVLLETHLQSTDHVVGDSFTLGDLNSCSMVMMSQMFLELSDYPSIQGWIARCTARPAWGRVQSIS